MLTFLLWALIVWNAIKIVVNFAYFKEGGSEGRIAVAQAIESAVLISILLYLWSI